MRFDFRVYVDEAGDEGFKFLPNHSGSSRWFVLTAVVIRTARDSELLKLARDVRTLLRKDAKHPLHFRHLRHEQRVPFVRRIGLCALRHVSVLIYKPSIADPKAFQQNAYSLYRYATRLLVERVSWLCRDNAEDGRSRAELIFSNRSAMSYDQLREYLGRLRDCPDVRIHWPSIEIEAVRAVSHEKLAGLQIADAVATSAFYAVHRSQYGEVEPGYLRHLARNIYRNRRSVDGYGLKFWCDQPEEIRRVLAIVADR